MRSIHEMSWWGLERFKPAPGETYTSSVLLLVCVAYGLPLAGFGYLVGWGVAAFTRHLNPLVDDAEWMPRGVAWAAFVANALTQGAYCWMWNRGLVRTAKNASK